MTPYTRNMKQTATYWAPSTNDGFGGVVLEAPVTIKCRWQDTAELFRDSEGREVTSKSIVYPAQQLSVRGYLALGDRTATADPRDLEDAYEIRQAGSSPDLRAAKTLYKVHL